MMLAVVCACSVFFTTLLGPSLLPFAEGGKSTYFSIPGIHYYRVLDGNNYLSVEISGACGGSGAKDTNSLQSSNGGFGSIIKAIIPVTSGENFEVHVGRRGFDFDSDGNNHYDNTDLTLQVVHGGFNGGGRPGPLGGGGGGGASDIRMSSYLPSRIAVAGGGGGGGKSIKNFGGHGVCSSKGDGCPSSDSIKLPSNAELDLEAGGNGGGGGGSSYCASAYLAVTFATAATCSDGYVNITSLPWYNTFEQTVTGPSMQTSRLEQHQSSVDAAMSVLSASNNLFSTEKNSKACQFTCFTAIRKSKYFISSSGSPLVCGSFKCEYYYGYYGRCLWW